MAIPATLTRDHILQAIERLKSEGVPANAESTRYDLIDSDGNRWPPKAVIEAAVAVATGHALPRSEFSGGDETNGRLVALGFNVALKPGLSPNLVEIEHLKLGQIISNEELVHAFKVGNSGGMRWSSTHNALVIIADHTKSLYDDRWDNDLLRYTGMGRLGDQILTGQNLRLAEQDKTGVGVHLFEVFEQNRYVYAGQVQLTGRVETEQQPDDNGNLRKVFVFPLRLVTANTPPQPTTQQVEQIRRQREKQLKRKSLDELRSLATAGAKSDPGRRSVVGVQYQRDEAVAAYAKKAAQGMCGLCGQPAPFSTVEGPYLESHHIVHLVKGGPDAVENAIALCPNCHRRMHILDLPQDRQLLLDSIAKREARVAQQQQFNGFPPKPH